MAGEATNFMLINFLNKAWPATERWEGGRMSERSQRLVGRVSGISQMVYDITWSPQWDYIAL